MSSIQKSPGFYGKVPVLGDFVSRRLPAHFVRPWDMWLQDGLAASREQLGSAWLDIYLTSPIWRFALSPGACGKDPCAGILMPSVDRVGRYFPLSLAVMISDKDMLPWLIFSGADWFGKLERMALSVLEDEFDLEEFDLELQKLVIEPFLPGPTMIASDVNGGRNTFFQVGMGGLGQIGDAFVHLSAGLLTKFLPSYSLWCTSGSERVKPSLLAYEGMPSPAAFTEFLAGKSQPVKRDPKVTLSRPITREIPASDSTKKLNNSSVAKSMSWRSSARSTVGSVRKANEDAYLERTDIGLWVVADGMGGHHAGGAASQAVVKALSTISANSSIEKMAESVSVSLEKVNSDLIEMGREYGPGHIVGSTIVAMLANGTRCAAVWVGDSRLYRWREGHLEQITQDHSLVAELSRMGGGSEDEFADDSVGNVLTRALGAESNIAIDSLMYDAREGDVFLLCSDGLVREVSPEEIGEILSRGNCDQSSQELIDLALSRGARDNVTVIVIGAGLA